MCSRRLVDSEEDEEVHIYDVNAVVVVTVLVETELEYLIFVSVTVVGRPAPADDAVVCTTVVVAVAVAVTVAIPRLAVVVTVAVAIAVEPSPLVSVSVVQVLTVDVYAAAAALCPCPAWAPEGALPLQCSVDSTMERATTAAARTPMHRPRRTLTAHARREASRLSRAHSLTARWLSGLCPCWGGMSCISTYALPVIVRVSCSGGPVCAADGKQEEVVEASTGGRARSGIGGGGLVGER